MRRAIILVLAAAAPWLALASVNAAMGTPERAWRADRCTRACHDRGCRHPPRLPEVISGDSGLYGATIRGLTVVGEASGLGRRRGYAAANLLLFCVGWPGLMLALLALVLRQRGRLSALRAEAREVDDGG